MSTAPRPIPLRPDRDATAREWRRSFVNNATVTVLSRIRKTSPEEIRLELRGAVEPMKAADYPGGTVAKLMLLAPTSAAAKLFELAVKVDLSGASSFSFPLASMFTEAKFVEEGFPIPVGQGTFEGMPLGPVRKVALIAALTNELETATASVASTIIEHVLKVAVGNGLAKVLFSADAATDLAPPGLLFGVTPIAAGASMSDDLSALAGAISAAGIDAESVVFVAAAEQAMAIKLAAGPHFNHRVISANIAPGMIVAVAVDGLAIAGSGVPVVDVSKHGTLHLADPAEQIALPGAPATIAAPVISMLQTDSFALRCVARLSWSAAPGAVAWIENAAW
ncbi:hypothetical protein [Bradyrhizobium valentinum]|uniref:Phage major capsid protein n=1 Tax=Bradyrhizobium valentinum TaxID=1518501 RepID=A0A0R3MBC0_9BRAD|nr:hypothetical protein [Bradyrhizobium valentinum]KRR14534.1 hypothetical protein CP49_25825 [Bradyrhizobium valentinum]